MRCASLLVLLLLVHLPHTVWGAQSTPGTTTRPATKKARKAAAKKQTPPPAPAPEPAPPVEAPPEPAKPEPAAPAMAEASTRAVPVEAATNLLQGPGDLDLRVHLTTDILLAFVEFGVAADLGVAPIGPGTLAVGAELNLGLCVTACGLVGALTGFDISDRYITPHARLTYHFLPPAMRKRPTELDLYGLFLAGVTLSTQTITGTVQGVSVDYQGTGAGLSLGVGAGAKLFFKERFFVGGEARLRYARGTYDYEEEVGGSVFSGVDEDWSQSGLSLLVFAGLRL